jgi:excisionase family DNA binding protein
METDIHAERADFLTSDQVIERLLSQPALRSRAATCVLPAIRVGSEWRFRRSDLDRWISRELGHLASPAGHPS